MGHPPVERGHGIRARRPAPGLGAMLRWSPALRVSLQYNKGFLLAYGDPTHVCRPRTAEGPFRIEVFIGG